MCSEVNAGPFDLDDDGVMQQSVEQRVGHYDLPANSISVVL